MSKFLYDNYGSFEDHHSVHAQYNNENENPHTDQVPQTVKALIRQNNLFDREKGCSQKLRNVSGLTNIENKVIDQYLKLKSQLYELAEKIDNITQKQRQRKKNKNNIEDDQRILDVKQQLKQQELRMQRIKQKSSDSYDLNRIVDKQNELKHLKNQLNTLQQEKYSLQKIRKTQHKATQGNVDSELINKKNRMEEQLRRVTQRTKKQIDVINEKQKHIKKLHEQFIVKEAKFKQYEGKLKGKKMADNINPQGINQLEEQLKEFEEGRVKKQREVNQEISTLEREKKYLRYELERRKVIFEEKEKQLRVNNIKHKEIVRLINASQNANLQRITQSQASIQNEKCEKRTVNKKGRQAPKIEAEQNGDCQQTGKKGKYKKKRKSQLWKSMIMVFHPAFKNMMAQLLRTDPLWIHLIILIYSLIRWFDPQFRFR